MNETPEAYRHRLHDLRGIQADFKAALNLLKSGYRFNDADAPAALQQLEKALARLDAEIKRLATEWKSP